MQEGTAMLIDVFCEVGTKYLKVVLTIGVCVWVREIAAVTEWGPARVTPRRQGETTSSQTPPLVEEEAPFQNTPKVLEKTRIMDKGPDRTR
jgi:hypothetical protein